MCVPNFFLWSQACEPVFRPVNGWITFSERGMLTQKLRSPPLRIHSCQRSPVLQSWIWSEWSLACSACSKFLSSSSFSFILFSVLYRHGVNCYTTDTLDFYSYGPFNCILIHKLSRQFSAFSVCFSGLISALLDLSTIHLSMKVSFGADVILCGWLGLKHKLTN